jgi:hypothetical protein
VKSRLNTLPSYFINFFLFLNVLQNFNKLRCPQIYSLL